MTTLRSHRGIASRTALAAVAWAGVAWSQPAGGDFQVNSYVTSGQDRLQVAMDADQNFVLVWESEGQDGHVEGVFGRRFDAAGRALGPEFQVNSYTTFDQRRPAIAMTPSGEFVVVWQSQYQDGGYSGIFARIFDSAGTPVGPEFRVNAVAENAQRFPRVAVDDAGNFVVVWQGYGLSSWWDIWGRRFDRAGNPLSDDFRVNGPPNESINLLQGSPSVVGDALGNFVVVWTSYSYRIGETGIIPGWVYGRRFSAAGVPLGPDVQLTAPHVGAHDPKVAMHPEGAFMVVWEGSGRVVDSSGVPGPFITEGRPGQTPSVAVDDAGTFVVAWRTYTYTYVSDIGGYEHSFYIQARRYDDAGRPLGAAFRASAVGPGLDAYPNIVAKRRPAVAARTPGRFIVAWEQGSEVFARSPDVIFADHFDQADVSAWSAVGETAGPVVSTTNAGLASTRAGLAVTVQNAGGASVQDDSPDAESRYRARFYLDPNGFDPGESAGRFRQTVFLAFSEMPLKRLVLVMLRRIGGQYALGVQVRRDDDTLAKPAFVPITDGPHAVEIDWQKATAPGASDGRFEMWIDGTSVVTVTGLDNDERAVDFVRMGALSVKAGAAGTLFFDEFVSRRIAYIGP